ncbi:hypothetical protein MYX07_00335 [Patescibacteria group bacterium AH-259-L07]|nr:hypothetical protein [Patescibacteria group bacterium AH-259-L07]
MSIINKYLDKLGLKIEDLTAEEKEIYRVWGDELKGRFDKDVFKMFLEQRKEGLYDVLILQELSKKVLPVVKAELRLIRALLGFLRGTEGVKLAREMEIQEKIDKAK